MTDTSIADNGKHYVAKRVTLIAPANESEVADALAMAQREGRPVIARGAGKSQAGLFLADDAIILDMTAFDAILDINQDDLSVRVQCGLTWDALRQALEVHGLTLASSQSYGVFSVGGSISVNAHGRNIDVGVIANSVLSFRMMLADGRVVEASRDAKAELFSLVLGGLGLFGVLLDATLRLLPNRIHRCRSISVMQSEDYPLHVARNVLDQPGLNFHFARFDIAESRLWERLYAIEYFEDSAQAPDSLPALTGPPASSRFERCVMGLVRRFAWARRTRFGGEVLYRMDMKPRRRSATVRESWSVVDHTKRRNPDWLQEYFIPREHFSGFVHAARAVLRDSDIQILNTTVRVVHRNTDAFLSYARQDSFSFVIYFELSLDPAAVARTETTLKALLDCALACGGAHYLCYQRVADPGQLEQAYPAIRAFFAAKRRHDPRGLFVNGFYQHYAPAFLDSEVASHEHA